MPIPTTTVHDVFLRVLLQHVAQQNSFDIFVPAEEIVKHLPSIDRHGDNSPVPHQIKQTIKYLENHHLVDWNPGTETVRITGFGVYTALLFDHVEEAYVS